ncbi:hypothetical protein [Luteibacter sp. CQ10]|uniref:hypothetical protein n=1 Tax=Luteibacter sp. CQ10 TaxID=2805821 RepID=UPI0034A1EB38
MPTANTSIPPYVLDGTEARTVHARKLGRDYQVFVSLPVDYADQSCLAASRP